MTPSTHLHSKGGPLQEYILAVDFRDSGLLRDHACGLFVDCRNLGAEVSFQLFSTCILSCEDFLEALELGVPSGYGACVEGYECRAKRPDHYLFKHGAVVTLWLAQMERVILLLKMGMIWENLMMTVWMAMRKGMDLVCRHMTLQSLRQQGSNAPLLEAGPQDVIPPSTQWR